MGDVALSVGLPKHPAPHGWEWVPLTSVAQMESGHTPSRKRPDYWGGEIPWIGIRDAKAHHGREIHETNECTNELGIANSSARILPRGTVCLSRTASVGYVVRLGTDMATSQDFANWVCSDRLDPRFLTYLFIAEGNALLRFASGAVHQTIYFPELKALHIALPPLEEQQRIVAILDEAFEGLDRARENAEANLENARELFGGALQAAFEDDSISWTDTELADLGSVITGSTPKTSDKGNLGDHLPFVKPGDFLPDGSLVYDNHGLSKQGASISRVLPAGSALMVCIGATIGKVAYSDRPIATNQQINAVVPKGGINGEYLYYQMLTPEFRAKVIRGSGQATLPIISKGKWSKLTVRVPSDLTKQAEIVETLSSLRAKVDAASVRYEAQIIDHDDLRQSLLRKAFAGELT